MIGVGISRVVSLQQALLDGRVFRGGRALARPGDGLASGNDALDAALPWNGFPRGALTELLVAADGLGELSLLLPALANLTQRERIVLIAPPYIPYAPALLRAGLPLAQLAWIDASAERALWTAEQCLRAGCLGAVLVWSSGGDERQLRRLQVAAEDGGSFGFLFRPAWQGANSSPAALRLLVEASDAGALRLRVLKCRGAQPPTAALSHSRFH
jgi:cell division inhibitor SulA